MDDDDDDDDDNNNNPIRLGCECNVRLIWYMV
jgi:hypothetical protein